MLDREAAHTAICMAEAWLAPDYTSRIQRYPNLCHVLRQHGMVELRFFLVDLAAALEEHAEGRIEALQELSWDFDVIPVFLEFFDGLHGSSAFAGTCDLAADDVAEAFRRTVEHLSSTDSRGLPT